MRSLDEILAAYPDAGAGALIPVLQAVQREHGYLAGDTMAKVGRALGVAPSRVYGVASFYNQFRFAPLGHHVIEVCRGTACHVKGSLGLHQHLARQLKLRADGNSPDGEFSVLTVACLGACSIAPVVRLDGEFYGHLTIEALDRLLASAKAGAPLATPTAVPETCHVR